MLGMVIRWLRVAAEAVGLFDCCDTSAFRVRPAERSPGGFCVTSDAEPGLQAAELETLASALRAGGYRLHLEATDQGPRLVVEGLGRPRPAPIGQPRPHRSTPSDCTPTWSKVS